MLNQYDLERMRRLEPRYQDNSATQQAVGEKTLAMVLGPTGGGKSTVIATALEFQSHQYVASWGEPGSIVTRKRRPTDSALYQTADEGVTHEDLADRAYEGSLTNFSLHPSGAIYATGPESFAYDMNLMPTLPSSVAQLERAGFRHTHAIYLTIEPNDLRAGLQARESDPAFMDRIDESIANVEYALDNASKLTLIRNSHLPGGKEMAADSLIGVVYGEYESGHPAVELAVVNAMRKCLLRYKA